MDSDTTVPAATTIGRVDLLHRATGVPVRVLSTQQQGKEAELRELWLFAKQDAPAGALILIGGDFNQDFGTNADPAGRWAEASNGNRVWQPSGWKTMDRLPAVPRAPEDEDPNNPRNFGTSRSGDAVPLPASSQSFAEGSKRRGGPKKVDYIFGRTNAAAGGGRGTEMGLQVLRDAGSATTVLYSHAANDRTHEWPSDHGMEALTFRCMFKWASKPWTDSDDLAVIATRRRLKLEEEQRKEKLKKKIAKALLAPTRETLVERAKGVHLARNADEIVAPVAEADTRAEAARAEILEVEAAAAESERLKVEEEEALAAQVERGE